VRYTIPLGAVLLFGLAAWMHPVLAGSVRRERRVSPGSDPSFRVMETSTPPSRSVPERIGAAPDLKRGRSETLAGSGKGNGFSWKKTSNFLASDLSLTGLQQEAVEQIFLDRSDEIRICHEGIRRSRVLDVRQYEWQVGRMKESWYRKIDSLLDSVQHGRFVALVEQGLFNEGLGFTEDPGMTVLE
jgi:hypothetical protein